MLVTFEAKKSNGKNGTPSSTTDLSSSSSNPTNASLEDDSILQNVKLGENTDQKVFKFTKRNSRGGCITCKIRKKRCSEEQPICSDCNRLKKKCVWATEDMTTEQIRELKKNVEMEEEASRLKRKVEFKEKRMSRVKRPKQSVISSSNTVNRNSSTATSLSIESQSSTSHMMNKPTQEPRSLSRITSFSDLVRIQEQHDENMQKNQTPIAANLLRMSHQGSSPPPIIPPLSPPRWENLQTDPYMEFNSFFESNIRGSFDKYSSNKITQVNDLDEETNGEGEEDDDDNSSLDNENSSNTRNPLSTFINFHRPPPSPNSLVQMNSPSFASMEQLLSFSPMFDFNSIPPPLGNPASLNLDPMASHLYDYYRNNLASIVSIVPHESNFYLKFFLPMAQTNPGVLNGILAWSAYHLGGQYQVEGVRYMEKALDFINQSKIRSDSDSLERLASLLIMCAAEICQGDVKKWPVLLQWGSKVIRERGGLFKFAQDKQQQWLISNFVYHDILASSTSERGTHFPVEDYENFVLNEGFGIDPLQGIVKPLFNIIGDISTLATECKRLLKLSSSNLGSGIMSEDYGTGNSEQVSPPGADTPESENDKKVSRYSSLLMIMQKASQLENKINEVKPDPADLNDFTAGELELQLTLFELFQLTAKLHLRQSVLRLNPSSLETQFILCELLKCLDIVLKSPVEGSLCFPMFIAGMNCTTKKDRKLMLERFNDLITRYSFKNLERAKTIMEQVWIIDPTGTKCVDWYKIVNNLKWDLSFA